MDVGDVRDILKQIEEQLASVGDLDPVAEQAIQALLNLVEQLVSAQQDLRQQVERLKQQLENKKKKKTTAADHDNDTDKKSSQHHSSEQERKKRQPPSTSQADRRSFKEVPIHQETECPLDPAKLPPPLVTHIHRRLACAERNSHQDTS